MKLILEESSLDDTVRQFFDNAEKSLLERREGQIEMALEISDAVSGKYPLAVEAGVGIGKSIAYLVTLVINFFRERRQVIIATSTIPVNVSCAPCRFPISDFLILITGNLVLFFIY